MDILKWGERGGDGDSALRCFDLLLWGGCLVSLTYAINGDKGGG